MNIRHQTMIAVKEKLLFEQWDGVRMREVKKEKSGEFGVKIRGMTGHK